MTSSNPKIHNRSSIKVSWFVRYFQVPARKKSRLRLHSDRGSALVMAAIFMVIATTLVVVGAKLISNTNRESRKRTSNIAEAENVAEAGLQDALGWFERNSTAGPVAAYDTQNGTKIYSPSDQPTWVPTMTYVDQAFNPQNSSDAQLSDTTNASIGIVNDYPLDQAVTAKAVLWGRYEVQKVQSGTDTNPNAVRDVSGERQAGLANGDGIIWSLVSTGYVYRRLDKTLDSNGNFAVAYNQAPNQIVSTSRVTTEIRKLAINLPTIDSSVVGAIYCNSANAITLDNNALLNGSVTQSGSGQNVNSVVEMVTQ